MNAKMMDLTKMSSIAMVCMASLSASVVAADGSGSKAGLLAQEEAQVIKTMIINSECKPVVHYPTGKRAATAGSDTYMIQLLPPEDAGFRDKMGGDLSQISMKSFHNATGTMFVVANPNGTTDITFDFYGLLPMGVYSLWDVFDADYVGGTFADAPLPDQSGKTFPVNPGFLGAPEGYGNHGFTANKCGSANFTIHRIDRPGVEFLLDFHGNGYEPGVKGETVFPGTLWGKFPEWN